jgi:hypothetical protein
MLHPVVKAHELSVDYEHASADATTNAPPDYPPLGSRRPSDGVSAVVFFFDIVVIGHVLH